jgi:ABC-2 type transport system ATP-binding protein
VSAIVRTEGLVKRYGTTVAVAGVDLSVDAGEIFGIVGPNGAGKSTTLKILATLLQPTAGIAEIGGWSVTRNADQVRRVLGFMPDVFGVYDDMKVWEYLDFFARCYGIPADRRRRMVGDLLDLVDLGAKRDAYVQGLSRGMQQRLCLAHTLVHDPQVLLLDEPASGLDPRARIEIRELLKDLRNMGKTILVSSHILHELSQICTRIGIVEQGEMRAQGSLHDIYAYLNLMRIVHVRVVNVTDALLEAIRRIDGVGGVEHEVDRISIRVRENRLAPEDLLEQLQGLGARVSMFQPEAMDMETVFMKLTEGKTS